MSFSLRRRFWVFGSSDAFDSAVQEPLQRRTAPACATGDTPPGRSSPPGPTAPSACRASVSCRCIHALHRRHRPHHQARRLAERPLQVGVADLLAARALLLAGARVLATHQPRRTTGSCRPRGSADLVDLVEQDQAQDRADAGDGPQQAEGHRVVDLGVLAPGAVPARRSARRRRRSGPGRPRCISRVLGSAKRSAISAVRLPA